MKHLYLLRHADSHPDNRHDKERPLSLLGKHQADQLSLAIAQHGYAFDKILVSSAQRTQETVGRLTQQTFEVMPELYNASAESLLAAIQAQADDINHLLVCAHNPGISELAMYLSATPIDYFSPANLLHLSFSVDAWKDIQARSGEALEFL